MPQRPPLKSRIGFTGHEPDDAIGLVNMRGRLYDARIGRFISADPLASSHSQRFNRYSYVENSPTGRVDPTGLDGEVPEGVYGFEDHDSWEWLGPSRQPLYPPLFPTANPGPDSGATSGSPTPTSDENSSSATLAEPGGQLGRPVFARDRPSPSPTDLAEFMPKPEPRVGFERDLDDLGRSVHALGSMLSTYYEIAFWAILPAQLVALLPGAAAVEGGVSVAEMTEIEAASARLASGSPREKLLAELAAAGVKHSAPNVVSVGRVLGKPVFLETGNGQAGLQHIVQRHAAEFAGHGVEVGDIPNILCAVSPRGAWRASRAHAAPVAPSWRSLTTAAPYALQSR
jgi:RHS repeat-associated protein